MASRTIVLALMTIALAGEYITLLRLRDLVVTLPLPVFAVYAALAADPLLTPDCTT